MRLLILSDVHANIWALRAIEKAETWDKAVCCGDLVDYGPFPRETIAWIRDHEVNCVVGNHDAYVLSLSKDRCAEARKDGTWRWAHENYEQLGPEELSFLSRLPATLSFRIDAVAYQMQHQYGPRYETVESEEQFDAFWQGKPEVGLPRCLLFGHTHRRCIHQLSRHRMWLNPGSVSYRRPDDHDKRAHYMVVEDGVPRFGALAYDRSALLEKTMTYFPDKMLKTDLQDALFFFGNAATTREEWT